MFDAPEAVYAQGRGGGGRRREAANVVAVAVECGVLPDIRVLDCACHPCESQENYKSSGKQQGDKGTTRTRDEDEVDNNDDNVQRPSTPPSDDIPLRILSVNDGSDFSFNYV